MNQNEFKQNNIKNLPDTANNTPHFFEEEKKILRGLLLENKNLDNVNTSNNEFNSQIDQLRTLQKDAENIRGVMQNSNNQQIPPKSQNEPSFFASFLKKLEERKKIRLEQKRIKLIEKKKIEESERQRAEAKKQAEAARKAEIEKQRADVAQKTEIEKKRVDAEAEIEKQRAKAEAEKQKIENDRKKKEEAEKKKVSEEERKKEIQAKKEKQQAEAEALRQQAEKEKERQNAEAQKQAEAEVARKAEIEKQRTEATQKAVIEKERVEAIQKAEIEKQRLEAAQNVEKEKQKLIEQQKKKAINLETEAAPQFANPLTSLFQKKIDTAFGIDISDGSVELLEFSSFFSHKPRVYSRIVLEEGIVSDGVILKKELLKEKLEILLKEAKPSKVSTNRVNLSLPEPQLYSWSSTIEKSVPTNNLKKFVYEESKKHIPLDYKTIYWDVVIYPSSNKQTFNVTFFAIEKKILNDYVLVCNELGLDVVEFSLSSMNVARVFLPLNSDTTSAIVEVGGNHTNVSIYKGNRLLKLFVTNPIGGDLITQEIEKNLQLTTLEAEEMKKKFGINHDRPEYQNAINSSLKKIFSKIKEIIDFYEESESEKIKLIYLSGGTTLLKGIEVEAKNFLGKDVNYLDNVSLISDSNIFNENIDLHLYYGALGLAISGVTKENKILSFKKQIEVPPLKMGFFKILQTDNFSKNRMIFDFTHIVYATLALIIISVLVVASLLAMSIEWGLILNS